MILVDSSVWIDFLKGSDHWTVTRLKEKINDRESIAYTELILLEVLSGIKAKDQRTKINKYFQNFILQSQKRSSILLSAEIYQELRSKGITIRSLIDCMISSISIEAGCTILHKDRDFDYVAKYYPIQVETK